jgi:hypothetical protein
MQNNQKRDSEKALQWSVGIFDKYNVPYQIVGGLAARIHGATRDLVDIDFYSNLSSPNAHLALEEMKPYIIWGPEYYKNETWEITFLKIDYMGQRIEIGDTSQTTNIFDHENQVWIPQIIHYDQSERKNYMDTDVNVMPKDVLIQYKKLLNRQVDQQDIEQLKF